MFAIGATLIIVSAILCGLGQYFDHDGLRYLSLIVLFSALSLAWY